MNQEKRCQLEKHAEDIRVLTLDMISTFGMGHVGGCLSMADLLSVLYFDKMNIDPADPQKFDRDRFVLSKGHGGPAVYASLALRGYFPQELCKTLNQPGTNLPSHCDRRRTPGIDMTTGSLGQGFSAAVGIALGQRMQGLNAYTYAVVGDGESQEGQVWEAAMLAGKQKLTNLIGFTDYNKLQIDGPADMEPLADKWASFGWRVLEVDGHDVEAIADAIETAKTETEKPTMILLHTTKGKGWSAIEGKVSCHVMQVSRETFQAVEQELRGGCHHA